LHLLNKLLTVKVVPSHTYQHLSPPFLSGFVTVFWLHMHLQIQRCLIFHVFQLYCTRLCIYLLCRMCYGLDDLGFESWQRQNFSSHPEGSDRFLGPFILLCNGYKSSFPEFKQPGCDVNLSPPFSTVVKSKWSCTSTPAIRLHDVDRENFYIATILLL
jgi:hypothetical protein